MATLLNNPTCPVNAVGNTAMPDCIIDPKKIVGLILIPNTKTFSNADLTSGLVSALVTYCQADSVNARGYPVFGLAGIEDKTGDVVISESGYGVRKVIRDPRYHFVFDVVKGGLGRHLKLRNFNKTNRKVLFVDYDGNIYGVKTGTAAAPTLTGFTCDFFYANPWKPTDGSKAPEYKIQVALSKPKELNESIGIYFQTTDVEETVKGVMDVDLLETGAKTNATFKFKASTNLEGIDLFDTYADALPTAGANCLNVVNKSTGAAITVSSIVKDATNKLWTVTITSSPSVTVQVSLKGPATLAGLGSPIGGGSGAYAFESNTIEIVLPS